MKPVSTGLLLLVAFGCGPNADDANAELDPTGGLGGMAASPEGVGGAGNGAPTDGGSGSMSLSASGGTGGGAGHAGSGGGAGTAATHGLCPLTPVLSAATTPTAGLIDEWAFEGRDDRSVVEKDHRHAGFLHRAVWRPSRFGKALKLYGMPESFAEVPSFGENFGSGFTVSLWIQTADKYSIGKRQSILKKGSGGVGDFELWIDAAGSFHFTSTELGDFDSKVNVMECGATGSVECPWHHLAVTYDGTRLSLYVDDVPVSKTATGSVAQVMDTLYFGADSYWGLIDQVRIFDHALPASEVSKLHAEAGYTPLAAADSGTVVAKVDVGVSTDGIDDFSADHPFALGGWGYVDDGASTTAIFAENTYSIYDLNFMFKSRRESTRQLTYRFTVPNGSYDVKLYFIEADPGEAAGRAMNVSLENKQVLTSYNILSDARELRTGVRKDFAGVVVSDGELTIDLTPVAKKVSIAGISVQKSDAVAIATSSPCTPRGPLYQDPTSGKLRDSSSIYNKYRGTWMHFGLGQQADDSYADDSFVAAEMSNGGRGPWTALKVPVGRSENDFGPDVVYDAIADKYHLFSGSFYKGIRHYTNLDDTLLSWHLEGANVVPGDGKVPEWDPAVWKVGSTWYMSTTMQLYESSDLAVWKPSQYAGEWPRKGNQNENPTVFFFHGYWWYTADTTNHFWRSSTGYSKWTDMGPTRMTGEGGERLRDQGYWPGNFQRYTFGHDAIVQNERCFLFYDVKYEVSSFNSGHESRVVNQVAECKFIDGTLYLDANEPFDLELLASQRGY